MYNITSEFSIPFCIFPSGVTGGLVFWGGGETVRRKTVWAGLFLNISTAVHAAAAAVVRFPRRPYITREARKRDLYRRGGASDPRLLFPD